MSLSDPVEGATLRVLSLGAGVQSSVLALLAARGEVGPLPDAAIFADTQWEPKAVYEHLDWLETQLPFPVHRVTAGDIRAHILAKQNTTGGRFASVPFHMKGADGSYGIGRRQCTREYKIDPIHKQVRKLLGLKPRQKAKVDTIVEQWVGISTDEMIRMKDSQIAWISHRWPLIELGWRRSDCRAWFEREYPGRLLPKSSCIGCPFHSNEAWRELKRQDPAGFQEAVEIDKVIRAPARGMKGEQFMHRSLKPLGEADLGEVEGQMDLFLGECEGMCGV